MSYARRVDANHRAVIEAMEEEGAAVTSLHKAGEGVPDALISVAGVWALVEIKDGSKPPSAQKLTEPQKAFWALHRDCGAWAIIRDVEAARRFVRALKGLEPTAVTK